MESGLVLLLLLPRIIFSGANVLFSYLPFCKDSHWQPASPDGKSHSGRVATENPKEGSDCEFTLHFGIHVGTEQIPWT